MQIKGTQRNQKSRSLLSQPGQLRVAGLQLVATTLQSDRYLSNLTYFFCSVFPKKILFLFFRKFISLWCFCYFFFETSYTQHSNKINKLQCEFTGKLGQDKILSHLHEFQHESNKKKAKDTNKYLISCVIFQIHLTTACKLKTKSQCFDTCFFFSFIKQ